MWICYCCTFSICDYIFSCRWSNCHLLEPLVLVCLSTDLFINSHCCQRITLWHMVLFTVICSLSRLAIVLVLTIFIFCSDRTGGHSKLIYCPHQLKGRLKWCTLNFVSSFMCEVISKRLIGLKFSYKRKCHELTVSVCASSLVTAKTCWCLWYPWTSFISWSVLDCISFLSSMVDFTLEN